MYWSIIINPSRYGPRSRMIFHETILFKLIRPYTSKELDSFVVAGRDHPNRLLDRSPPNSVFTNEHFACYLRWWGQYTRHVASKASLWGRYVQHADEIDLLKLETVHAREWPCCGVRAAIGCPSRPDHSRALLLLNHQQPSVAIKNNQ